MALKKAKREDSISIERIRNVKLVRKRNRSVQNYEMGTAESSMNKHLNITGTF